MKAKKKIYTASTDYDWYCSDCGWPIVICMTNDEMSTYTMNLGLMVDYFGYCSNKGCKNHKGDGYSMELPEWFLNI